MGEQEKIETQIGQELKKCCWEKRVLACWAAGLPTPGDGVNQRRLF